jgi:hypothetical protein
MLFGPDCCRLSSIAHRGLRIVDALADAWGVSGDVIGRTVWFRAGWGTP